MKKSISTEKYLACGKMEAFFDFCIQLGQIHSMLEYPNKRILAHLASYFWNRFTAEYKRQWKTGAKLYNRMYNWTGNDKIHGFWLFALSLERAWINHATCLYHDLFHGLRQGTWTQYTCIENEIDRVTSHTDSKTL